MQQELKYIYQIYLDKSFSKAAEYLYITQPALSIAIQKIEANIGMVLFDRTTRSLSLTPAGEIYIESIKETLKIELEMEMQISDLRDMQAGSITIGGSHYLNAYILPPILSSFSQEYPKIEIRIIEGSSAQIADMLADRKLDLIFNCNPDFMMNFEKYPAFHDHILLAVPGKHSINHSLKQYALCSSDISSGRHLEQDCPTVNLNLFRELDFILLTKGNNLYDRSHSLFQEAGFTPRIKMELSQLVTAYHLAEHGLGATFISDRLIIRINGHLCYYKLDSELTKRLFYMLLPSRKYTSNAVKTFIKIFSEYSSLQEKTAHGFE